VRPEKYSNNGVCMEKKVSKLSRKQHLINDRMRLTIEYWQVRSKLNVYWLTLTSCPSTKDMRKAYTAFVKRFERNFGQKPEAIRVTTSEGAQGVYHCFWALKAGVFKKTKENFAWLKTNWEELTGAWNLWVELLPDEEADRFKVARYSVTQYCAGGQGSSFVRVDWPRTEVIPVNITTFTDDVRKFLRNELEPFSPWHIQFYHVRDCVRSLLLGKSFVYEGKQGDKHHEVILDCISYKPILL
jgi:hypothetical protein